MIHAIRLELLKLRTAPALYVTAAVAIALSFVCCGRRRPQAADGTAHEQHGRRGHEHDGGAAAITVCGDSEQDGERADSGERGVTDRRVGENGHQHHAERSGSGISGARRMGST